MVKQGGVADRDGGNFDAAGKSGDNAVIDCGLQ